MMVIFGWMLVAIYFGVVLLIILLLCGIQLVKLFIKHWPNRQFVELIFFKGKGVAPIRLVYSDGIHAVSRWYCYGFISSRKSTTGECCIMLSLLLTYTIYNYRPIKQIKILFFVMIIRLIVSVNQQERVCVHKLKFSIAAMWNICDHLSLSLFMLSPIV